LLGLSGVNKKEGGKKGQKEFVHSILLIFS
jgi:hypothetical protein